MFQSTNGLKMVIYFWKINTYSISAPILSPFLSFLGVGGCAEEGGWAGHGLYWTEEGRVVEEAALGALLLYPNLGM